MLPVAQAIQNYTASNDIMINDLERVWKEAVVA
jgi:hypothetical protein